MGSRRVNAVRALPEELLRQVSEALGGNARDLWIPGRKSLNRKARNRHIVRLHNEGYSAAEIAGRFFVSERTVWRVLAKERARRAPSAASGG